MAAQAEHVLVKNQITQYKAHLSGRGGDAAAVAQALERLASQAAASPEKAPLNLAVWGGLLEVVTAHRSALRQHLDAAAVLRCADAAARAMLGNLRAELDARVLGFVAVRYAGLVALIADPRGARGGAGGAFANAVVAIHHVLETAPASDARTMAAQALGRELDGATLRVAVALGGGFVEALASSRRAGDKAHADAVAAGRCAALLRLAAAHGSDLVECAAVLYPAERPSPLANLVVRTAIAGGLAAAPDFARLVDGPVALLRLALQRRAADAVDALVACCVCEDPREVELAALLWAAFLAGCERRLQLSLLGLLQAAGHQKVVDRAVAVVDD